MSSTGSFSILGLLEKAMHKLQLVGLQTLDNDVL
jgi:hypothetical protein